MNITADSQPRRAAPGSPGMIGNRSAFPHRFHLSDGRVLKGNVYKVPNSRLADHLSTLKGYISSTDVQCERTGQTFEYLAINSAHIVFIEEIADAPAPRFSPPATRSSPEAAARGVQNGFRP